MDELKIFVIGLFPKTITLLKPFSHWKARVRQKADNKNHGYAPLTPIADLIQHQHYVDALSWAIKNRHEKGIKNIALTGPYGAGKSSILKTLQECNKKSGLRFLDISLATFQEPEVKKTPDNNDELLLRSIEISILQQIFYRKQNKKTPDSRFKMITSLGKATSLFWTIGFLLFTLSLIHLSNTDFIPTLLKDVKFSTIVKDYLHYASLAISVTGIGIFTWKICKLLGSIRLSKLKIYDAEIELCSSQDKSILNKHLDEILHFFSQNSYSVVLIEDLDRFNNTEIFTNLREINSLINNYADKNKKDPIVFVYAVKDDMFDDYARTKFFDFIVPVIPTINSSNSGEKLRHKNTYSNLGLTEPFIDDISFFIDDMRLLHNICNEFIIYKNKLAPGLSPNSLFAFITYKNLYPQDFAELSKNKGALYAVLNNKATYISNKILDIDNKIKKLKKEIEDLEKCYFNDIKNIRRLYILKIIENLENNFVNFEINNKAIHIEQLTNNKEFEYIINNKLTYLCTIDRYNEKVYPINVDFENLEKEVNSKKTYSEWEKEVNDKVQGKSNIHRKEIQKLEQEKTNIRGLKIGEILQTESEFNAATINALGKDYSNQKTFVRLLVTRNYITEDYWDYISIFHEGSLTRSDHAFLVSIITKNKKEYDYKLVKTNNLAARIHLSDFSSDYVLNYSLVDHIIADERIYQQQLDNLFKKLADRSEVSIDFIYKFIEHSEELEKFIKFICQYWTEIWQYIENDSTCPDSENIYKLIVQFADISDIKQISQLSGFTKKISQDPYFLSIYKDKDRLKDIVTTLDVRFALLNFESSPTDLIQFVYEHNHYEMNIPMLQGIITTCGNFDHTTFNTSNYVAIEQSDCPHLQERINKNINEYIKNIYLQIESNSMEDEPALLQILNNKKIEQSYKLEIAKKTQTLISNLNEITDTEIQKELFTNQKIVTNWENIAEIFNSYSKKITDEIVTYLNSTDNAKQLSDQTYEDSLLTYNTFWRKLFEKNEILTSSLQLLIKARINPAGLENLDISSLTKERTTFLIENDVFAYTHQNFNTLREINIHLGVKIIEQSPQSYTESEDELILDSEDINLIFKSTALSDEEKSDLLTFCSEEDICTNVETLELISSTLCKNENFSISQTLIKNIIHKPEIASANRLHILVSKNSLFTDTDIQSFLLSTEEYSDITNRKVKAAINNDNLNTKLLDLLKKRGLISSYSVDKKGKLRVNHKRA